MPYKNRDDHLANGRQRYLRNGEAMRAAATEHYHRNRSEIRAKRASKRTVEAKAKDAARERARYKALRIEVLAAYGGQCSCCGEVEPIFLELDHSADDGAEHRRAIGRGAMRVYRWAKLNGWPKDRFRLLCANCNQGRARNGGVCPHANR